GEANGVEGIRMLNQTGLRKREPHVNGIAALEIPSTGICSAEELVRAYARIAAERGVHVLTHARVRALDATGARVRVTVDSGDPETATTETIEAQCVVNAAGWCADHGAALLANRSWQL